MTARQRVVELAITDRDLSRLMAIARSRTEPSAHLLSVEASGLCDGRRGVTSCGLLDQSRSDFRRFMKA
jgi:hypothetical protein